MNGFIIHCKAKNVGIEITNHFKKNLNKHLESNEPLDNTSIKLSQESDMLIVREQSKRVSVYGC